MFFSLKFKKLIFLPIFISGFNLFSAVDVGGPRGVELFVETASAPDKNIFQLSDEQLAQMKKVKVRPDEKFHLTAVVNDSKTGDIDTPVLHNLDNFVVHEKSQSFSSFAGLSYGKPYSLIQYQYVLSAKKEGTYDIGPITIATKDGRSYRSDVVKVIVDKSAVKAADIFLKARVLYDGKPLENNTIFVGQKLDIVLELWLRADLYSNGGQVEQISESADFSFTQNQAPWTENPSFENGVEYRCRSKTVSLVCLTPGLKELPKISCMFEVLKSDQRSGSNSIFGLMMVMSRPESGIVTANNGLPIVLNVEEVDPSAEIVGTDFSIALESPNKKLEVGQGATVKYLVYGSGDFGSLGFPELVLPEGCRAHTSSNYFLPKSSKDGKKTKVFEYIVQFSKDGEVVFEPQKLTCFDIKQKRAIVLESNQLVFYVKGQSAVKPVKVDQQKVNPQEREVELKEVPLEVEKEHSEALFGSFADNQWLFLFMLFFVTILLLILYNRQVLGVKYRKTFAFSKARSALNNSGRSYEIVKVYYIFLEYFALRLSLERQSIDVEAIYRGLCERRVDPAIIKEVITFLEKAADIVFGQGKSLYGQVETSMFFKSALDLLNKIEINLK